MMTDGDETSGGEHAIECTDVKLHSVITNTTPVSLILNKVLVAHFF